MSEEAVLADLAMRSELVWLQMQWWVSLSTALIVAGYLGAQRLNVKLIACLFWLYFWYTGTVILSLTLHQSYVQAAIQTLRDMSETTILSPMAMVAVNIQGVHPRYLGDIFFISAFLFTVGSVIYSYLYIKNENEESGT